MYELDKPVRSFAIANDYVKSTNKACYSLGTQLVPFCIFADDKQKEYGVLDFADFDGFYGNGQSFVEEISSERREAYQSMGVLIGEGHEKTLVYDYFLSSAMCYVEISKWVTKMGVPTATYDKFLCTRNPAIMSAWMGQSQMTMQARYSSRIMQNSANFYNDELRLVKLVSKADGNAVTVPRTIYSVKDMRCVPVYMLHAFIAGLKTRLLGKEIIQFEFLKDNGTVRELATTLNEDILMDYYQDNLFVAGMLAGVDIESVNQGGMMLPSRINRGYIKLPELGASKYDDTGCRSLNLTRILSAKVVDEVDRSYIDVDLNAVLDNFSAGIDCIIAQKLCSLKDVYEEFVREECVFDSDAVIAEKLKEWARGRSVWLSTTFQRELHSMIVSHPLWFPYYTGKRIEQANNTGALPKGDLTDAGEFIF